MYYQTFEVVSKFAFPIDMLRYDSCFPADQNSASLISDSISQHGLNKPFSVRIGRFVRLKRDTPTIGRWQSFGCKIFNVSTKKV